MFMIIEMDTRNKKDNYVTDFLDKNNIKWIRNKLYCGDVKLLNDTKVIIDLKANIEEIAHNLCNTKEHERIKREVQRAKEIGCEKFIFLIKVQKIKNIDDLVDWSSKKTKVKGLTLVKIMKTMHERYGCNFIFTSKENAGKIIVKLLKNI